MKVNELGRLQKVDLREVFATEAGDFTPWLAQEENLKLLGEAIGIDLQLESQEKDVGPFRADILCKDTATDNWVLVENQIERTDHNHLGQLLTYAAGLQAVTIVWVAERFTDTLLPKLLSRAVRVKKGRMKDARGTKRQRCFDKLSMTNYRARPGSDHDYAA